MATSQAVLKRVAALNRSSSLSTPLRYSEVKGPLEEVGEDAALKILADLEAESDSVTDAVEYIRLAVATAGPGKKRKAGHELSAQDGAAAKRIRKLNGSGKLLRPIAYERVQEPLASISQSQAMTILLGLQDLAGEVRDPTAYIRAAVRDAGGAAPEHDELDEEQEDPDNWVPAPKSPPQPARRVKAEWNQYQGGNVKTEPGRGGVKSEELSDVDKIERRISYLNRNGNLNGEIHVDAVLPALDSIGLKQSMRVLMRLEESGTSDPTAFITDSVAKAGWVWSKSEVIDDDEKVAKRVAWLNQFGGLLQPINWAEVADGLDALRVPHAMVLLRELEVNAPTVRDPTKYVKQAIGAAGEDDVKIPVTGDPDSAVSQRIAWLNTHGKLAAPIDESEVGADLIRISEKEAMYILQDIENKGPNIKDPTGFIKFKMKAKLAALGTPLEEELDDETKLVKRIEWLNDYGGIQKDIDYNRVAGKLNAVGIEHAMTVLKELEDKRSTVANPTSFIMSSLASANIGGSRAPRAAAAVGSVGGGGLANGGADIATLAGLVELLSKKVKKQVKLSQVAGALDALGPDALQLLQDMQSKGLGLEDPVAYIRAAAQRKKTLMSVKSEDGEELEEDDVGKLTKRITWLNRFGGLRTFVKANDVVGALYCLGIPQSMAILRGLQERAAGTANPTQYIKQAIQKANGVSVTAKEEQADDGEDETMEQNDELDEEMFAAEAAALADSYDDPANDDFMDAAAALADEWDEDEQAVVGQPAEEEAPRKLWPETKVKVEKRVVGAITGITKCVPPQATVEKKRGPAGLIKEEPGEEAGNKSKDHANPISPHEKLVQIRNLALKNGLELDELCLKALARLPFYRSKDMIDEVVLGGRNRQGVRNPSRYLTLQIQKAVVGLGVEQGIAMELAVSLGVVLNNDALDELASIPRKEAHNLIRELSKDPEAKDDPMGYIQTEVERVRAQTDARPFGSV